MNNRQERNMEHILIIGGSGILRNVSCHFANEGRVVSVVARDKAKIVEMIAETQKAPGLINPIAVDYTDVPTLQKKLVEAVAHLGSPVMTITRISPAAFLARQSVAGFLNDHASGSRMFDLVCRQADSPGLVGLLSANNFKIMYRRIILGSMMDGDRQRRAGREEVLAGISEAIQKDVNDFVIGNA